MVVKSVHSNVEGETTIQSGMLYTINPPPPQKKKKKLKNLYLILVKLLCMQL